MAKAAKKVQTKNGGSSNRRGRARGVVRPFIWSGSLANALSSDSSQESTGEIGDLELAVWRPGSKTAEYLLFLDL